MAYEAQTCQPPLLGTSTDGNRRRAVVERGCVEKTAEERFNMSARGWLAYPVAPAAHATTAEERL